MNERMLKLYKQAQVPHTAIDPSNNMPYATTIFSAEKFAELIVWECARFADNSPQYVDGREILEHFGVDE